MVAAQQRHLILAAVAHGRELENIPAEQIAIAT